MGSTRGATSMRARWWARLALAALAVLVPATTALGAVTAYNEPAYTRTAGNDTFWWAWQGRTGLDAAGNADYRYLLCGTTLRDGVVAESAATPNDAGNGCASVRGGATDAAGDNEAWQPFAAST